jgi:hypothetical protein
LRIDYTSDYGRDFGVFSIFNHFSIFLGIPKNPNIPFHELILGTFSAYPQLKSAQGPAGRMLQWHLLRWTHLVNRQEALLNLICTLRWAVK